MENLIYLESNIERKLFWNMKEEFREMKDILRGCNKYLIRVKEEKNGGNWREVIVEGKL